MCTYFRCYWIYILVTTRPTSLGSGARNFNFLDFKYSFKARLDFCNMLPRESAFQTIQTSELVQNFGTRLLTGTTGN